MRIRLLLREFFMFETETDDAHQHQQGTPGTPHHGKPGEPDPLLLTIGSLFAILLLHWTQNQQGDQSEKHPMSLVIRKLVFLRAWYEQEEKEEGGKEENDGTNDVADASASDVSAVLHSIRCLEYTFQMFQSLDSSHLARAKAPQNLRVWLKI